MATRRIVHDQFRALCVSFGRMKKTEFIHKMYRDHFEWPVSAALLAVCPVIWVVRKKFGPQGEDLHKYHTTYTISRAENPG